MTGEERAIDRFTTSTPIESCLWWHKLNGYTKDKSKETYDEALPTSKPPIENISVAKTGMFPLYITAENPLRFQVNVKVKGKMSRYTYSDNREICCRFRRRRPNDIHSKTWKYECKLANPEVLRRQRFRSQSSLSDEVKTELWEVDSSDNSSGRPDSGRMLCWMHEGPYEVADISTW